MSDLSVFNFNSNQIRVVDIEGEPWFVAKDVCDVLELGNVSKSCERLDDDEKGITTIYTLGGNQDVVIVSESGLYSLTLTSRKPQAKEFKRWLTHEVLPSIRKTGTYVIDNKLTDMLSTLLKQQEEQQNSLKIQQESLNKLLNDKSKDELVGSVIKEEFSGLASLIANTIGEFELHHLESIDLYMKGHTYMKLEEVFNSFFPSLRTHYNVLTKSRYAIGKCYEELTNRKLPVEKGNFMFNRETVAFALWRITNVAQKQGLLKESPNAVREQLEELYSF